MLRNPPTQQEVREGLIAASRQFIVETDLGHVIGESGTLRLTVDIHLERDLSRWVKGGVAFERRIDLGGK